MRWWRQLHHRQSKDDSSLAEESCTSVENSVSTIGENVAFALIDSCGRSMARFGARVLAQILSFFEAKVTDSCAHLSVQLQVIAASVCSPVVQKSRWDYIHTVYAS